MYENNLFLIYTFSELIPLTYTDNNFNILTNLTSKYCSMCWIFSFFLLVHLKSICERSRGESHRIDSYTFLFYFILFKYEKAEGERRETISHDTREENRKKEREEEKERVTGHNLLI
ncbi:hypothetical protein PUN28_015673 [Cardiocondyla obscurior]|uniref:Uncharacterized protein n=1 Tax=Cardiocondyla obscurior TaxID=286306 RepID=A0AAW2EYL7_9HYME